MKKLFNLLILFYVISLSVQAQFQKTNRNSPIIIDHQSVKEFRNIPQNFIDLAASRKLIFLHASVGSTIDNGLNCIQGTRTHPAECKEFEPYKYNRSNWKFQGLEKGGWFGKCDNFTSFVNKYIDDYDIFSFKYCYLEGLDDLMEPCGNPFNGEKVQNAFNYLKNAYETLENNYPDKIFVIWTIPLTQTGQFCTDTLNALIRKYVNDNNMILFDIADIETFDPEEKPTRSEQGLELAYKGYCGEQQPGAKSCHPNWTCSIMLAKAFWVMVAKIAGWEPITSLSKNIYNETLIIYPIPALDYISIRTNEIALKFEIRDIFGNILIEIIPENFEETIKISHLNRGMYIVKIYHKDHFELMKFIKE